MKQVGINIILIVVFILLIGVVVLSFVAEVEFDNAKKLKSDYRWKRAGEQYQAAVHLNPFNAEYFAGAGDFLVRQSEYRKGNDKTSWLKRAEKLYERASQLNPRYAEYWYKLGETYLKLKAQSSKFKVHNSKDIEEKRYIDIVVENFRKAIERDPYNFRNNYLIGHNLLTIWNILDVQEKNFALDRLRYVLQSRPWYGSFVYPAIIYYAEDFALAQEVTPKNLVGQKSLYSFITKYNLWQYRRQVKKSVDFYRQKEEPTEEKPFAMTEDYMDWTGKSQNGKNEYRNGHMYWEGTVNRAIKLPEGKAVIHIQARGDEACDVWPYMIVELDGEEIGETFVDTSEWKEYFFEINTDGGGVKVLSVIFANDGVNNEKHEDRNLYVGEARIEIRD